ncbi:hypothetical protein I35_7353 [Burkholderia cenocepacia H111]|nr:hypothetical protein I35_7353 [Burkholderia cenocepacia H111]
MAVCDRNVKRRYASMLVVYAYIRWKNARPAAFPDWLFQTKYYLNPLWQSIYPLDKRF